MRNHRVVVLLIASCLALLAMSFGAGASADPSGYPPSGYPPSGYPPSGYPPSGYPPSAGCTLATNAHSVSPGDRVALNGSGFAANASVQLTVQSGKSLGAVRADDAGTFRTHVTVPAGTGKHVRFVAASGSVTCSLDPTASSPQQPASSTAHTGFIAIIATVVALALLGGGVLFVFVGRGRRA